MLHPLLLWGLAGLGIPVVIHLIQRQRLRPQVLATLQFLDQEDVANAFQWVPRDVLQLLLRLLLLLLFVLLMARLTVGSREPGPRTLAVILDNSMSMQQRAGESQTLFDVCKQQVLELIDGLRPQDKLALTLVGDEIYAQTGFLDDRAALRQAAEAFEVSDGGGLALLPAVRSAVRQLLHRHEVNPCVLVFSDGQRANFASYVDEARQGGEDNPTLQFRRQFESGDVKLIFIENQPPVEVNLSLLDARPMPQRVYVGGSARLTATVHNATDEPQQATLTLTEDQSAGVQREILLAAGETAHVDLVHRFETPLDTVCRVELAGDALAGDNRFFVPMRRRDRRQVLLVAADTQDTGDERDGTLELSYRGADLLAYALNPGETLGAGSGTHVSVKRVTAALLERVSLPLYSAIVFYGVTDVSEQSQKDLHAFVSNGGGLWIVPPPDVSPLRFNESFQQVLGGLALGQARVLEQVAGIGRSEGDLTHPALLALVRGQWGDPQEIHFAELFQVENLGGAQVALRSSEGDPLAIFVPQGRGRVFLQLFTCELDSGSLPRSTAFVPLVQQVLATLAEADADPQLDVVRVGEVLRTAVPEYRGLSGEVQLQGPQPRRVPLVGDEADEMRIEGLWKAGAYEAIHPAKQTGRRRWIAVNPVAAESDLGQATAEETGMIFGEAGLVRVPFAALPEQFTSRREIFWPMFAAVFAALVAEALCGAWQSRRNASHRPQEAAP